MKEPSWPGSSSSSKPEVPGCTFISIGAGRSPANCLCRAAAVSVAAASAILGPGDLPPNYSAAMTLHPDPDLHRSGKLVPSAPPVACTVWLSLVSNAAGSGVQSGRSHTGMISHKGAWHVDTN